MPQKPEDIYGTYGGVPQVPSAIPEGGGARPLETRANPEDFGGQIGASVEKLGGASQQVGQGVVELSTKFAQEATEAKVNDDYANKYAPAAAQLREQYDSLRGQDKIHGYQSYIGGLQSLNHQFTGDQFSPYGKQIMSGLIDRHVAGEIDGAKRELVQSQNEFSDRAATSKIEADQDYAASNYNNPATVDQVNKSNDATILMQHIDKGYDPNHPDDREVIQDAQKSAAGQTAVKMIQSAVSRGDATAANNIRATASDAIPGYQQIAIDKTLHTENMRQTGINGATALKSGQPLPETVGAPPAQVQSVVADAAQSGGVDANHALTVARIESSMGQDVGSRGDIGQTGKGGNLQEQATNMVTELKKSETIASNALGRPAQPWEQYVVYQQGAGGGPALLRAATENPNAKAIDVLAPLYSNPKDAKSAIVNNGGNDTMTAGDYLNHVHDVYEQKSGHAACTFSNPQGDDSLGKQIVAPHQDTGPVLQPAASPRGMLNNFNEKMPAMMERAAAIPNIEVRANVMKMLNSDREKLQIGANAYSAALVDKATKLAVDPKFTDMNQVPSDMASALLSEHPETMRYLENMSKENLERGGGSISKDMKEYGSGMYGLMRDIGDGKVNNVTDLMKHLPGNDGTGGDLTIAGFDKLKGMMAKDPESQAETMMRSQAFKVIKRQLSGEDDALGIKDPQGEKLFAMALPKLFKSIEDGHTQGLHGSDLYDPSSKNWIGNTVASLKRSSTQMSIDMLNESGETQKTTSAQGGERTPETIRQEFLGTTDPTKRAALKKELIDRGFIRDDTMPEAPIAK